MNNKQTVKTTLLEAIKNFPKEMTKGTLMMVFVTGEFAGTKCYELPI